jgi:NAD(P)H-nitrite reductase large subunit
MVEAYDFVIIGNSAAGLQALQTLRRHDRQSSIALIDRENRPAYSRVLTPYYIGGHIPQERLDIVVMGFYEALGITMLFGQPVVELDADRHELRLGDGRVVRYGKLLLATGAEARTLAFCTPRVCVLRHMADAERLAELYQGVKVITAIGAGLVSLPLLSHAPAAAEKHLIVGSDRIFSRVVDPETSALLEELLIAQGLHIHKQNDIRDLAGDDRLTIDLACGKQLHSDLLIIGKGVAPNVQLAAVAGLDLADGIIIDEYGRSTHPDIFAAGDAAEGRDYVSGLHVIQGNWMTAVEQGENAALNMLGRNCRYPGSLKNNITEIFGIDVAAIGYCHDDVNAVVTSWNPLTGRFRKVFLDERELVVGAVLVGETNDAGLYYHLITTRSRFPGRAFLTGTAGYAATQMRLAS